MTNKTQLKLEEAILEWLSRRPGTAIRATILGIHRELPKIDADLLGSTLGIMIAKGLILVRRGQLSVPVKLELGKRYVRRDGEITEPLRRHPGHTPCPFFDPATGNTYTLYGAWKPWGADDRDLVAEYVETEPKPLKLEVGKRYVRRDGKVTEPLVTYDDEPGEIYPFVDPDTRWTYTPNGIYNISAGPYGQRDLVAEYVEPAPEPATANCGGLTDEEQKLVKMLAEVSSAFRKLTSIAPPVDKADFHSAIRNATRNVIARPHRRDKVKGQAAE